MSYRSIVITIICFGLGWFGHLILIDNFSPKSIQVREDSSRYRYINPLLYVDNNATSYQELDSLKDDLEDYVEETLGEDKADRVSVYYRDLNSGAWTGVNPDDKFAPASILKVAALVAYFRIAEDRPGVLDEVLYYKKDQKEHQNYPPHELPEGSYKVSQLLDQAIVESDNAAAVALANAHEKELLELYKAFRFPLPQVKQAEYLLSPREVSLIFRSLYSSTYLLDSYSEKALDLLTKTTFNKGLMQGVEKGVLVANKFGEHTVRTIDPSKIGSLNPPTYQLHDCGIVYYPKKPYLICVMTEGKNLPNLEKVIGEISGIAYSFMK